MLGTLRFSKRHHTDVLSESIAETEESRPHTG